MRPVLVGDIIAAACVLLADSEDRWVELVDRLVWQAKAADRYRRRLGKPHPDWGNGSLMAAARSQRNRRTEPFPADIRFLRALACVLDRLIAAKLPFVSGRVTLYNVRQLDGEGKDHGRNQSQDGSD